MELMALYKRVIGLDIHQAQITACALIEEPDGSSRIEQRQFGGFKRKHPAAPSIIFGSTRSIFWFSSGERDGQKSGAGSLLARAR